MAKQLSRWQIFKLPIILFILSITGIVAALLVDGEIDLLASLALASTLIVTAWYILK
ncbi:MULTISPECIES: hypothetical protein [unclassified Pseudoalteromonas]|uniref:hypothetical protein n=1 Tax=unclassified Pseudoalteromonas TaxID=194690 RepID=UPI001486C525|nr:MULTISPECIES: hypothetical protein [unclassified Pseudoalteromonas]BDF94064.1 hypothetical protein KAN5_09020 [Pseudoalteromonas sp. KAN5]